MPSMFLPPLFSLPPTKSRLNMLLVGQGTSHEIARIIMEILLDVLIPCSLWSWSFVVLCGCILQHVHLKTEHLSLVPWCA